ncbi:hypothetical protein BDF21DRAFT_463207 [Thamnidium elegans]|uniref:F-box domain-containing protein n=1 Tax=Thamnidium elegans TaxID=101142 RepID=A0A8H7VS67_9FUNG|nr:hypothetical protein INT48_004928 [Thamnidium elegans]KAI8080643.1 hypothetical protein BDF21DRAFT_463207 [Thamnidium elegans]
MEKHLPAEILLVIGNYVHFKEYIQLSQTCKTIERILTSSSAVNYLNDRFKFGQDTGALLLFTYYNILYVPKTIRRVVLNHFINTTKQDMASLIKGWSIIHAIRCSDPGKFMTILLDDEQDNKSVNGSESNEELILKRQQLFAVEIFDDIIDSHIGCKTKVCKTKTYRSVFKKLVLLGDLRTVEHCLRSLGSPVDSIIIFDLDYYNRFPLNNRRHISTKKVKHTPNIFLPAEIICKNSLYFNYNSDQMSSLTENLLTQYNVQVERESKHRSLNINQCFMNYN